MKTSNKTILATAAFALLTSFCGFADDSVPAPSPDGSEVKKTSIDNKSVIKSAKELDGKNDKSDQPADPADSIDIIKEQKDRELTPDQIRQIKLMWEDMRRAQETPQGTQPKPVISVINLDLSPGSTPPLIRISNRTGVILDFMDAGGSPWPIENVVNMSDTEIETSGWEKKQTQTQMPAATGTAGSGSGNKQSEAPVEERNSVFVKAKRFGSQGNVGVFLKGMSTPVIVTLLAGQKDVDYRVDFRVPGYIGGGTSGRGNAKMAYDNRLASASMGITAEGCQREQVNDDDAMVWSCDGKQGQGDMLVRSSGILLSPAPLDGKKLQGVDGTHAYLIPSSPVVTIAFGSRIKSISIGESVK
jgi:intracellular multiplication protein IcmK